MDVHTAKAYASPTTEVRTARTENILNRLSATNEQLARLVEQIEEWLSRRSGSLSATNAKDGAAPQRAGTLGGIDDRLDNIGTWADRLAAAVKQLEAI